jgi:L-threonylcarbamoyladenylate synthase
MRVVAPDGAGIDAVLGVLDAGQVVGVPTDTVYGLAARWDRPEAVAALFALKGRPDDVAIAVLVGTQRQARALAASWPRSAAQLSGRLWPGALTLVVPAAPDVHGPGASGATVGIRVPDHRFVRRLSRRAGPLAVTSANLHGEPPCTQVADLVATWPTGAERFELVVDGGTCDGIPSTVVDCTTNPPTCLREGGVPWSWVLASLR